MSKLSHRALLIKPSATLAITAKAKQMAAEGIDVIGFGAGEPDFTTPSHITEAAIDALRGGDVFYTPVGGTPKLRKAIIEATARDYGVTFEPGEVTASVGAKHTLFNLFMALVDHGDEVIVPAPYWVSYPEQVAFAGGEPVIVEGREENGFLMCPEALAAAVTPKTKALILNSPSNPTGAMYHADALEKIAEVVRKSNFMVVSDDIYAKLVYDGSKFTSLLEVAPDLKDRVIIVNGVSKSYAMTGWRLGYACGPKWLISAMENIQSQSTSNPTSFVQAATATALTGDQHCIDAMRDTFEKRRNMLVDGLNAIPGFSCRVPEGAFYAFPNVTGLYGKKTKKGETLTDSMSVTAWLLDEARVAVIPGGPFGAKDNLRLSYATHEGHITDGLARIRDAVATLS